MIEQNYDILKKHLDDLPQREVPDEIWDSVYQNIRAEVPDITGERQASLPSHMPPDEIWNSVQYAVARAKRIRKIKENLAYSALLIIPLIVFLLMQFPLKESGLKKNESFLGPVSNQDKILRSSTAISVKSIQTREINSLSSLLNYLTLSGKQNSSKIALIHNKIEAASAITRIDPVETIGLDFGRGSYPSLAMRTGKTVSAIYLPSEWLSVEAWTAFNQLQKAQSFEEYGIEFSHHWGKSSVSGGLAIYAISDEGSKEFRFLKNELIRSFEYVDSIYIDPQTDSTHYYTSFKNIYDSVLQSSRKDLKRKYTFLHIPFRYSYGVFNGKNFNIKLKAGFGIDLLLERREYLHAFQMENARLIDTRENLGTRLKTNYRLMAGISFDYRLYRSFVLSLSPAIQKFNMGSGMDHGQLMWTLKFGIGIDLSKNHLKTNMR